MNLVQSAMRRPLTIMVVVIAVALGSILAVKQMPRDIFPSLGIPTIYVAQPYGGMDPSQMESFLTYFYEYHFLYITGIRHVESRSIQGAALIKLEFYPGTNMQQAMAETVSYVDRSRAFMPPGTVPPFVIRFDAGSVPVGDLVFSSKTRTVGEMQDLALNSVRPLFATLRGVSAPPPFGGAPRTILISVKPERLRAYNMAPDEVIAALVNANTISPSGNIPLGGKYPMVPLNSVVKNIQDLNAVPIRTGVFPTVFLRDIGNVVDGSDTVTCYALVNGRRTVYIPVTKRADASTLAVVNLVKEQLPRFQAALPPDVTVSYQFDQSPYVIRAIASLTSEGALGAVLSGLMVLLFLRDWRSALIVVLNIPLSLMGAVMALWITGQTVNIMTLGGLALAIGILVDMSTVVIENIHTQLAQGKPVARAVSDSGREVALPLLISMLCVLAVFVPSFFMEGAAKGMFVPLSLAVGFSMIVSYLLASTFVPILATWIIPEHQKHAKETGAPRATLFSRFRDDYKKALVAGLRLRWLVVGGYLAAVVLTIVFIGGRLGTEIFPKVDTGQLKLRLRAPTGTDINGTEAAALKVFDIIKSEVGPQNVAMTLGFIGIHSSNYAINYIYLWNGGPEEGVLQVQLKRGTPVRTEELQERLRKRFAQELPSVRFSFEPGDIVSQVMSLGSPTPIEVAVAGPDMAANREFSEKVRSRLEQIPILRDVQFGESLNYPTLDVAVDRELAGVMGIRMSDAAHSLLAATSSSRFVLPNYWADPKTGVAYQAQVQIPQDQMTSIEQIKNIPMLNREAQSVLLRNIGQVNASTMVGQIARYDMQRMVTVTANVSGADLGRVGKLVTQAVNELGNPPRGMSLAVRGQVVPLQEMTDGLEAGLLLAVVVIFLLLAANFESAELAFIVVSTTPAAIAGSALALWLTNTTLNIQSFMGMIMAIGVAVANAILLVTFAERYRIEGAAADAAAAEGAASRLRPILMTAMAMLAGMTPMALGLSEGGQQTAPLGRAVVGGLALATVATLLALPSVFAVVRGRAGRHSPSLDPDDPESRYFLPPDGPGHQTKETQ